MKYFYILLIVSIQNIQLYCQNLDFAINDTIIAQLSNTIDILGLGDPTHQESTITKYRIDLIKKLVSQKDFKIIAIEGNMYGLYMAHQKFLEDKNFLQYEKAMYAMLNSKEMEELYEFVYEENRKGNEVQILGFDPSFSSASIVEDISKELENIQTLTNREKRDFIKILKKANITNLKALFRNNRKIKRKIMAYIDIILGAYKAKNIDEKFFRQALQNLKFLYSQNLSDKRDIAMADNIDFLREVFPKDKIILFGSSTHLLKKPKAIYTNFFQKNRTTTLGQQLTQKYHKRYCFIAYTAISGQKWRFWNKSSILEAPKEASIESKTDRSTDKQASFISQHKFPIQKIICRFLGHSFMKLSIWEVMDALVLLRDVKPSQIKKND